MNHLRKTIIYYLIMKFYKKGELYENETYVYHHAFSLAHGIIF